MNLIIISITVFTILFVILIIYFSTSKNKKYKSSRKTLIRIHQKYLGDFNKTSKKKNYGKIHSVLQKYQKAIDNKKNDPDVSYYLLENLYEEIYNMEVEVMDRIYQIFAILPRDFTKDNYDLKIMLWDTGSEFKKRKEKLRSFKNHIEDFFLLEARYRVLRDIVHDLVQILDENFIPKKGE